MMSRKFWEVKRMEAVLLNEIIKKIVSLINNYDGKFLLTQYESE